MIYYSAHYVYQYLEYGRNAEQIEPRLAPSADIKLWHQLYAGYNTRYMMVDRSGVLPALFNMANLRPLPAYDPRFNLSFEEICFLRAAELKAEGTPIRVFWSGGIDSTVALLALIESGVDPEVVYTAESVQEYPEFFKQRIQDTLRTKLVTPYPHPNFADRPPHEYKHLPAMGEFVDPAGLNVTGSEGDKLFNSTRMMNHFGWENALKDYRDVVPRVLTELTEPLIAGSPVPINNLHDFCWYSAFCLFYQDELLQLALGASTKHKGPIVSSTRAFFDSPLFEQWAMAAKERNTTVNMVDSKRGAKEFILKYTGDREYYLNKPKVGSLRFLKDTDRTLFITISGETIYDNPYGEVYD